MKNKNKKKPTKKLWISMCVTNWFRSCNEFSYFFVFMKLKTKINILSTNEMSSVHSFSIVYVIVPELSVTFRYF